MKMMTRIIVMFAILLGTVTLAKAFTQTIYDNIPNPIPGNVPSVGYEATSTSEWGNQVQFDGVDRQNAIVTVLMSSWACQSGNWYAGTCVTAEGSTFNHPVTLNVYTVGDNNTIGSLVTSKKGTFDIPYRPSSDVVHCTGGAWWDGTKCFNGKAFTISYDLSGTTLPDKAIVTIAYNTSHYGEHPIGNEVACYGTAQGCPYDSLNVGTNPTPAVGTALPTEKDTYLNSSWSGAYCDGSLGTGTLRLDSGCWGGYLPAIRVETKVSTPTTMDQCKNDGWKSFTSPIFKNQGDCVSYVQSNDHATGNKTK